MIRKTLNLLFLFWIIISPRIFAEDDFQYWSLYDIKLMDTKYVDFSNHSQLRFFDDTSDLGLWFTSQRFKLDAFENLGFGLNYTYLQGEIKEEFKGQHRLELEINPHWKVNQHLILKNRNRFEFRWIEDKGSDNSRFRHRWDVVVPISKWEWLNSFYFNNELFVDFGKQEINENRVIPLGINFRIASKINFSLFYMIQSKKGLKDWSSNQIVGSKVAVKL